MKRNLADFLFGDLRRLAKTKPGANLPTVAAFVCLGGLLFALVAPSCGCGDSRLAKIKATQADLSNLAVQLGVFNSDNGRLPTSAEGLHALIANPANLPGWKRLLDRDTAPLDQWGHPYIYRSPGANGKDFDLFSAGPDGKESTADDVSHE